MGMGQRNRRVLSFRGDGLSSQLRRTVSLAPRFGIDPRIMSDFLGSILLLHILGSKGRNGLGTH